MNADRSNVQQLPGRECRCEGDGATWADVSACMVHNVETSPLSQAVAQAFKDGAVTARLAWMEAALKAIAGPADSGPFIWAYRDAGGGYEGLQAIARLGLGEGIANA